MLSQTNTAKVTPILNGTSLIGNTNDKSVNNDIKAEELLENMKALEHVISRAIDQIEVAMAEKEKLYAIRCECGCRFGLLECMETRKEGRNDSFTRTMIYHKEKLHNIVATAEAGRTKIEENNSHYTSKNTSSIIRDTDLTMKTFYE